MMEEDKYMDDQFRKAGKEIKFPYQQSFWMDVQSQLADDSLDSAFKSAADNLVVTPQMDLSEGMDDAFLDESFKTASTELSAEYQPGYWEQFQANLPLIQQDEAFLQASNSTVVAYQPHYWNDADVALQNEGLHYEYKSTYWNEAKLLLDKADRGIFFLKWSAVAAILLLFSASGIYLTSHNETLISDNGSKQYSQNGLASISNQKIKDDKLISDQNLENNSENLSDEIVSIQNLNSSNSENFSSDIVNHNDRSNEQVSNLISHKNPILSLNGEPILVSGYQAFQPNDNSPNGTNVFDVLPEDIVAENLNSLSTHTNSLFNESEILENLSIQKLQIKDISETGKVITNGNHGPLIKVEKAVLNPTHTISLIGQAGFGNQYGVAEFTPLLRTSFGIEYLNTSFGRLRNFEFGGRLSMNHIRQNDFGTERRVSVFENDGGVNKFWYKLQIKDMLYSNLSAICNYRINQKNKIKLSFGIDYLVFVQSNMSYQTVADQGITTVNNNWGVKDGLNKFDLRLGLGYEYQLTNRLALQANASVGFFDRTDNDFLQNLTSDHEMNLTFGIKYTLFRKL